MTAAGTIREMIFSFELSLNAIPWGVWRDGADQEGDHDDGQKGQGGVGLELSGASEGEEQVPAWSELLLLLFFDIIFF